MSERIGIVVLRKVAEHYRVHPESWCHGAGTLRKVVGTNVAVIHSALDKPGEDGCIHTLIACYATVVAGERGRRVAEKDAVRIFCEHIKRPTDAFGLQSFNDKHCQSQKHAILLLEAAIGNADFLPPTVTATKAPATIPRRQLVTACFTAALVMGTLGSAIG